MRLPLALILCCLSLDSAAVSFLMFDAKTMGTSGAGSMTASGQPQPHTNPTTFNSRNTAIDFSVYLGARITDRENFVDTLESLQDREEQLQLEKQLQDAKRAIRNNSITATQLRGLSSSADIVRVELDRLPNKPLRLGSAAGVSVIATGAKFAGGAFVTHYAVLGAIVENDPVDLRSIELLSDTTFALADVMDDVDAVEERIKAVDWPYVEDLLQASWEARQLVPELKEYRSLSGVRELETALQQLQTDVRRLEQHINLTDLAYTILVANRDNLPETLNIQGVNLRDYLRYPVPEELNTRVIYSGAEVEERGINLSSDVPGVPGLSLGVNIKQVLFSTIAFTQQVDDFDLDAWRDDATRLDYDFWNLDVGCIYQWQKRVHFALAVKGLRHKQLHTLGAQTIQLSPLLRGGASYQTEHYKLALDVDLTQNEPLGFDPDKQYLSVGGEWYLWPGQTLRMGYRYNFVDGTGLPSLGLGVGAGALAVDLAASYDHRSREAGVGVQLGFRI